MKIIKLNYLSASRIVFILALTSIIGYYYFDIISSLSLDYLPLFSDEYLYCINALNFFKNTTLEAAITFNGTGSLIFGSDSHGFAYTLLHGMIAKVFGWHSLNFIIFNLTCLLASIVIYCSVKSLPVSRRIYACCMLLLFPITQMYAISYMQETIHLMFSVILSLFIYLIYRDKHNRKYIIYYVAVICVAGTFRCLWFFWLIGLVPLAENKKQLAGYFALFISGVIISYVFAILFIEPVPNYLASVIKLLLNYDLNAVWISLTEHFDHNIQMYFCNFDDPLTSISVRFFNFFTTLYFIVLAVVKRDKKNTAIALIGIVNFSLLFVVYDAFYWREIRTMSPLFYFYILFLVVDLHEILIVILVASLMYLANETLSITYWWIGDRNGIHNNYNEAEFQSYQEVRGHIPARSVVLLDFLPDDYSCTVFYLPLSNSSGEPIRYAFQYYPAPNLPWNYVICRSTVNTQYERLVQNDFIILAKNKQ